jgi:hypothetical protein
MMALAVTGKLRLDGRQLLLVRDAVADNYDYEVLEQDLRFQLDRRLGQIAAPDNLRNVVFRVLDTAEREGWLPELLGVFQNGRYPAVREVITRVLAECAPPPDGGWSAFGVAAGQPGAAAGPGIGSPAADADPFLNHVIGRLLFIDRSGLRSHLRDLLSDSPSRVLVVTGERPCGKSYTWFYVRQRELLGDITPVLVDLSDWAEPSGPVEVMSSIGLQLGLPEPTIDEHAQGAAQAQRLRDWLVGMLQPRERDGHRYLLVFDSLDHVAQRDDTLQLIEYIAGAAIRQRLAGLRVILLGYTNRLPIDPLESVLTEEVRDIGAPELREFFGSLAHQANLTITDQAIDVAVNSVLNLLPDERAGKLRQLPRTVREVGNAAFGRRVLP